MQRLIAILLCLSLNKLCNAKFLLAETYDEDKGEDMARSFMGKIFHEDPALRDYEFSLARGMNSLEFFRSSSKDNRNSLGQASVYKTSRPRVGIGILAWFQV